MKDRQNKVMICNLAHRFRMAIEKAKVIENGHCPFNYFGAFPDGMCGFTSDLLAVYLKENGFNPVLYVNGSYKDQSHTWVEVDDNIVDITAEQFKFHPEPLRNEKKIYVGKVNSWYKLFDQGLEQCVHYGKDSWADKRKMQQLYDTIMKYMD